MPDTSELAIEAPQIMTEPTSIALQVSQVLQVLLEPSAKLKFVALIYAKQFLKQVNSHQLNIYIAEAIQRIHLSDQAKKAEDTLRRSKTYVSLKLWTIDEDRRNEVCHRWAAFFLLQFRQAMKQGVVGDLGIDWEVLKAMSGDEKHRKILNNEEDMPQAAAAASE